MAARVLVMRLTSSSPSKFQVRREISLGSPGSSSPALLAAVEVDSEGSLLGVVDCTCSKGMLNESLTSLQIVDNAFLADLSVC